MPRTLSFQVSTTVPVTPYYLVPSGATWLSVTQAVYGTNDPAAVAALRAALGDPPLTAGSHIVMPATVSFDTGGRATTIAYSSTGGSGAVTVNASANSRALGTTVGPSAPT